MDSLEIRVEAVLSEVADVRHAVDGWLKRRGMREPPRAAFVLATHEAVVNAIQHSGAVSSITVRGEAGPEGIEIAVADTGEWTVRDEGPNEERGRGLQLIRALVPDSAVSTGASGTTVRLRHPRP